MRIIQPAGVSIAIQDKKKASSVLATMVAMTGASPVVVLVLVASVLAPGNLHPS